MKIKKLIILLVVLFSGFASANENVQYQKIANYLQQSQDPVCQNSGRVVSILLRQANLYPAAAEQLIDKADSMIYSAQNRGCFQ